MARRAYNDTRSFRSFGGATVFNCECCERKTRITTQDDDRYCAECYDLLGIQNSLWDEGKDYFVQNGLRDARDNLVSKLSRTKADIDKVKAYMKDLFAV